MQNKIAAKTKTLIQKLDVIGLTRSEIVNLTGVSHSSIYGLTRLKEKGYQSCSQYLEYLAHQKGYKTRGDYQKELAKKRKDNPKNKELSDLIRRRLKELKKSRKELAEEIKISERSIDNYLSSHSIPSPRNLKKLFQALKLPYRTLNDL